MGHCEGKRVLKSGKGKKRGDSSQQLRLTGRTIIESGKEASIFGEVIKPATPVRGPVY